MSPKRQSLQKEQTNNLAAMENRASERTMSSDVMLIDHETPGMSEFESPLTVSGRAERQMIDHQPRVLSLDGGGVRGLSSLVILREIMEEIQRKSAVQDTPLPCQFFDLIGGTSTGGLIAIMLGRLRMV